MIDVFIVHNDPKIKDLVKDLDIKTEAFYHFLDEGSLKERKKAFRFKEQWAARAVPFIAVYVDDVMTKGFYSEADNNVLNSLKEYLNNYETDSNR